MEKRHKETYLIWKSKYYGQVSFVETMFNRQFQAEEKKWRDILTGICFCFSGLLYLTRCGLALLGDSHAIDPDDDKVNSNFLKLLELISMYDPAMKAHSEIFLQHQRDGKKNVVPLPLT